MKYPSSVTVVEVGPRDGFQSIKPWIETADKIETCRRLLEAGIPLMECTSFISPKAIPQMKDAEEVVTALLAIPGAADRLLALVGNKKGADRAHAAGVKKAYPDLHIKLDLATAFGCPFQGEVSMEEITYVLDGAVVAGIRDICLCDTIGVGMPDQVGRIFRAIQERYGGRGVQWSVHLHGHGQHHRGHGGRGGPV